MTYRVYLSGPMSSIPEFNYPAFNLTAKRLRLNTGWTVLNPAEHFDGRTDLERELYMRKDVEALLTADAIALMPGWRGSQGATLEHAIAQAIGLDVLDAETLEPLAPESVCEEADRLVSGDRQADYGHPIEDFTRTGRMWGAILGIPDVDPALVGLCMVALKVSRECHRPKRDNRVDGSGYFKTVDMVRERQGRAA